MQSKITIEDTLDMNSYRFGKVDKQAVNDTILSMQRDFATQKAQNASSYTSMRKMLETLSSDLTYINNMISNYTYQNTYMKSLVENL